MSEKVPGAVRNLLASAWLPIDAEELVAYHAEKDARSGQCHYFGEPFTSELVRRLVAAGALPASLAQPNGAVNQHASHSLQQCLAEMGEAYARHIERVGRYARDFGGSRDGR